MIIKKIESMPSEKEYYKKHSYIELIPHKYYFVGSKKSKHVARFKTENKALLFVKIVSFVINIKIKIKAKIKAKIMKVKDAIKNAFKRKRN